MRSEVGQIGCAGGGGIGFQALGKNALCRNNLQRKFTTRLDTKLRRSTIDHTFLSAASETSRLAIIR